MAEWTAENLANMSLMHSGRWQRRSGARLATEFMPRARVRGVRQEQGRVCAGGPEGLSHAGEEMEEERAENADFDPDAPYVEKDPNFANPADVKSDRSRRLAEYERELAALESRGDSSTTRVTATLRSLQRRANPGPGRTRRAGRIRRTPRGDGG